MPTPFPGMDPYLEHCSLWPDVHNRLIAALGDGLGPRLRPRYYVRLEERTYVEEPGALAFIGRPDLSVLSRERSPSGEPAGPAAAPAALAVQVPVPDRVRESYLEVRSVESGDVVTVLEILSPGNKRSGDARRDYEAKRLTILGTRTSLVEVDLLREGRPMAVYGADGRGEYRILVARGERRPRAELYVFDVRDTIPTFRLPLLPGDEEPLVDLGAILHGLYDRAAYDLSIGYRAEPVPPLREEDRGWAHEILKGAGVR
ncbi:MAG: DUF4058 family protein [Planctomycetes bacterium]|nr:DUF4058 family protein [Planctomycetota bacterium]